MSSTQEGFLSGEDTLVEGDLPIVGEEEVAVRCHLVEADVHGEDLWNL